MLVRVRPGAPLSSDRSHRGRNWVPQGGAEHDGGRIRLDLLENVAQMFSPHGLRGSMTRIPDSERRRAFSIWLRTGRFASVTNADGVELKFNPWHDPGTGRFTFVGAGQRHGQWGDGGFPGGGGGRGGGGGATGSGDWSAGLSRRKPQIPARGRTPRVPAQTAASADHAASLKSSAHEPFPEGTWTSGGFVGGGGGSFRGAGASGTWGGARSETASISFTGVGDGRCVFGSDRRDTWDCRTAREHAERRISYGRSQRLCLSHRRARADAARFRYVDDCLKRHAALALHSGRRAEQSAARATTAAITSLRASTVRPTRSTTSRRTGISTAGATVCSSMNGRETSVSDGR
jgi:hypothetical protein